MMSRCTLLVALPLLLATACDKRTDEELRSMMEEVAEAKAEAALGSKVEPLMSSQLALGERVDTIEAQTKSITAMEIQLAELSAQMVGLETQVAEAQTRLDKLAEDAEEPAAPVRAGRPDPAAYYKVELGDAQAIGPDSALVTIVTWSDFQCPFCSRVSPTIDELRRDYGKDLRYVFMHNPLAFHKQAEPAARAAEAAGEQGKFWEMHDLLFENSRDLTEKNFAKWARKLGLDVKRFKRDFASSTIANRVEEQQRKGNALGARGTPAFFVNGRFLSGAQPVASFKVLIDEEMKKAEAKVAAGTPRSGVYAATIAGGKTSP